MTEHRIRISTLIAAIGLSATAALSQDDSKRDTLKGPAVEKQEREGNRRFSTEDRGQREAREPQLPMILGLARRLGSDEINEPLRLTPDQAASIRGIATQYADELANHVNENKKEIRALLETAGLTRAIEVLDAEEFDANRLMTAVQQDLRPQANRRGQSRDLDKREAPQDEMDAPPRRNASERTEMTPERREALRELREIMNEGPSSASYAKRAIAELDEKQQAWMNARLKELSERQRRGQTEGRERMRQRLENLSPEEREQMLEELRKRREGRQPPRDDF